MTDMSPALISIDVWRDSASSAVISVYRLRSFERVTVVAGDTLDLELEEGMRVVVGRMPDAEEALDERLAHDAAAAMDLEDAS